jgi:hypothetical protein
MSLSQTLTSRRDADLLQRALDGDPGALGHRLLADDQPEGLAGLLRLTDELPHPRVRPDPAFVARLRDELLAEARQRPAAAVTARRGTTPSSAPAPTRTRALTVPRGGRLLAGLATMVLLLGAILGGASSGALPGDALYPVKLMIGDAQVRLAGSDLGRGQALLGQLDRRLDEVDALVAAGDPAPSLVDETLLRASDDLGDAQRQLLTTDSGRPDPRALQVLSDAGAQATGRLAGLRQRVPISSVAGVDRLLEQLAAGQRAMMQQLDQLVSAGTCGSACDSIRAALEQQGAQLTRLLRAVAGGGLPALVSDPASPHPGQAGLDPGGSLGLGSAVEGRSLPTSAPTAGTSASSLSVQLPGASLPGVSLSGAGVTGDTGGGLTATVPGPTVSLPGASVGVPSVTVGLPGTTSTGLPLPEATVPETTTTIGGVTVPLPGASVGGDCTLGLGDLCLGG